MKPEQLTPGTQASGYGGDGVKKNIRFTDEQYAALEWLRGKYPIQLRTFASTIRAIMIRAPFIKAADIEKAIAPFRAHDGE